MIKQQHIKNQELQTTQSLLKEVHDQKEMNFYEVVSDFKYHLDQLDILLSELNNKV